MDPHRNIELSPDELDFSIDPVDISRFRNNLRSGSKIIGQPRALQALRMGCRITDHGYNIFVTGMPGTGRRTAIERVLREYTSDRSNLKDIAVVHNFNNSERPIVLYLDPGKARRLKKQLHDLIETLKRVIKAKLEGEPYNSRKNAVLTAAEAEENNRIHEFEKKIRDNGFHMIQIDEGGAGSTDLVPVVDGEPVSFDELQDRTRDGGFPPEEWNCMREIYHRFMDDMRQLFRDLRTARSAAEEKVMELRREIIKPEIQHEVHEIRIDYREKEVHDYLTCLEDDILDNLYIFTAEHEPLDESGNRSFIRYGVHILVDHSQTDIVPVIFENRPDSETLLGAIEYRMDRESEIRTNFMMIRPGSMVRASGGFLIIDAEQILKDEQAWHTLKHVLKTGLMGIHPPRSSMNLPIPAPRPEPVRIDMKVILIGGKGLYDALYTADGDFCKLFKVAAEFDDSMNRDTEGMTEYLSYIHETVVRKRLGSITDEAAAEIVAFGAELAENRNKLSTRFFRITDLLTEARYWANGNNTPDIDRASVLKAIHEHTYLFNLPEEHILELVKNQSFIVRLEGEAIGRINGLAVQDRGCYSFGVPVVVSCSVSPGDRGVVNIEREAGLSGEIHDKWVFIYRRSASFKVCRVISSVYICRHLL